MLVLMSNVRGMLCVNEMHIRQDRASCLYSRIRKVSSSYGISHRNACSSFSTKYEQASNRNANTLRWWRRTVNHDHVSSAAIFKR